MAASPIHTPAVATTASETSFHAAECELIERVLAGESELFWRLIQPCERRIYRVAISVLRNPADAEEVCQETIIKSFKALRGFRRDAKFSTWLLQITMNEARMRLRKRSRVTMESLEIVRDGEQGLREIQDTAESPSQKLERHELRDTIFDAIQALPEIYRSVFMLRDVQHLSMPEAARSLGISKSAIKIRLFRARLQMRERLERRQQSNRVIALKRVSSPPFLDASY